MSERELALLRNEVARLRLERERLEALPPRQEGPSGAPLTIKQRMTARRWVDGYTFRELAAEEGVSVSSIAARVRAARLKLGVPISGPNFQERDRRRVREALGAA